MAKTKQQKGPLGPAKLKAFLDEHGISKAKAGLGLNVSHVTIGNWITEKASPIDDRRKDIEIWTGGVIVESDWETEAEKKARKDRQVTPFVADGAV